MQRIGSRTLLLLTLLPLPLAAATVEQRLQRLESILDNRTLSDIDSRIESLQRENAELRALIEENGFQLKNQQKQQKEFYLDLDQRLQQVERGGAAVGSTGSSPVNTEATEESGTVPPPSTGLTVPANSGLSQPANRTPAPPSSDESQAAYQRALDLLKKSNYPQARDLFRQYLMNYSNSREAPMARYWLAETSYMLKEYSQAVKDYQLLLEQAPRGNKSADALLKLIYCYRELKQPDGARQYAEQLMSQFAGSHEAKIARDLYPPTAR